MFKSAEEGDVAAARFIVERLCGVLERGPTAALAVQLNAPVSVGHPVPDNSDLATYIKQLSKLAGDLLPNDSDDQSPSGNYEGS